MNIIGNRKLTGTIKGNLLEFAVLPQTHCSPGCLEFTWLRARKIVVRAKFSIGKSGISCVAVLVVKFLYYK